MQSEQHMLFKRVYSRPYIYYYMVLITTTVLRTPIAIIKDLYIGGWGLDPIYIYIYMHLI